MRHEIIIYIGAFSMAVLASFVKFLIRKHDRQVEVDKRELMKWQKELEEKASELRK